MKKAALLTLVALAFSSSAALAAPKHEKTKPAKASKDYSWLKPGFVGVILPGADSGASITLRYEKEGFVVCATSADPTNGVMPAPGHCNIRLTNPGYHIPATYLLGGGEGVLDTFEEGLKIALAAVPLVAEAFNLGVVSEASQAAANVVAPSPMVIIKTDYQLSRTMRDLLYYAQFTTKRGSRIIPVANIQYSYADVVAALQARIDKFVGKCSKHGNTPFCHQQKFNSTFAVNIMSLCNLPIVTASVGEPGQGELWWPGQPLPDACKTTLSQNGYTDLLQWESDQEGEAVPFLPVALPSPAPSGAPAVAPSATP
jgi:hypothetical protein